MLRSILKWCFRILTVPVVVGFVLYSLDRNEFFNLNQVDIQVDNLEHPDYFKPHVMALKTNLDTYMAMSLWKLPLAKIGSEIKTLDWIQSVRVSRQWPNGLEIRLTPKKILAVLLNRNMVTPISMTGEVLPEAKVSQVPDAIVIRSKDFNAKKTQIVKILNEIPENGKFSRSAISELSTDDHGSIWLRTLEKGIMVRIESEEVDLRSARVSQVMEYLDNKELNARVIDANLSKKVLVKLRKSP